VRGQALSYRHDWAALFLVRDVGPVAETGAAASNSTDRLFYGDGSITCAELNGGKIVERAVVRLRVAKIWASSGAGVSLEDGFWSMNPFCFMVAHTREFCDCFVHSRLAALTCRM
jgi:hypothetical protein